MMIDSIAHSQSRWSLKITLMLRDWPQWIVAATAIVSVIYSLAMPAPRDVLVTLGWAQITSQDGGISGILETWHLRGVGYKISSYLLFTFAERLQEFFPFDRGFALIISFNFFLVAFTAIIAMICTLALRRLSVFCELRPSTLFAGVFVLLSGGTVHSWGQAEHISLLFSFLIACLAIGAPRIGLVRFTFIVILSIIVITQKAITVLFLFPVFILVVVSPGVTNRKIATLAGAFVVATLIYILLLFTVLMPEFQDLKNAAQFQGSFKVGLRQAVLILFGGLMYSQVQPSWILAVAFFCVARFGDTFVPSNEKRSKILVLIERNGPAIVLIGGFFASLLYVIIQAKFFVYHYSMLHFTAMLVVLSLVSGWRLRRNFVAYCVIISIVGMAASFTGLWKFNNYALRWKSLSCEHANGAAIAKALRSDGYDGREPILYLSPGVVNVFADAPSYDRYFYVLPLQRVRAAPGLPSTPIFKDTLAHLLDYRGRYIIWTPSWYAFHGAPELEEMVARGYQPLAIDDSCDGTILMRRVGGE